MGLRGKTVFILLATIALASLAVVIGSRLFFQNSLDRIERAEAEKAVARALALVEDDLDQLDITVRDWAFWDDAWEFVESRDASFAEANLSEDSFESLELSAMLIVNSRGETVFGRSPDYRIINAMAFRFSGNPLPVEGGSKGVLWAGDGFQLCVARPILRNDASGPSRGALVMARALDDGRLARYSRLSGLAVSVLPLPPGAIAEAGPYVSLAPDSIEASMPIPEYGRPSAARLGISVPRAMDRYSGRSLATLLAGVILAVALFGMMAVLAFEVAVLGRMRAIGAELLRIAEDKKAGAYLKVSGRDELTDLERTMNATLASFYASIKERNAAIREIHHRVKNNLQLIASLINLQTGKALSGETAETLRGIGRRVLAMAFVHEELDIDRDIESVDAARLLERICVATRQSAGGGAGVEAAIECGGISLGLQQAIPVGLIAGEVLSNSYRHAFPEGGAGAIAIALEATADGGLSFRIRDDGVGLASAERSGLGMDIIQALAQQLRAGFRYESDPRGGALFSLEMPAEDGAASNAHCSIRS